MWETTEETRKEILKETPQETPGETPQKTMGEILKGNSRRKLQRALDTLEENPRGNHAVHPNGNHQRRS